MKRAFVTGTIVSLAVTAAWAWLSSVAVGPAGPMDLTLHHPAASYISLAAAPTGNGWELFAVVAFIFGVCFLVTGLHRYRHAGGGDG